MSLHAALALAVMAAALPAARAQLVTIDETFTGTTMGPGWVADKASGTTYNPILTAASGIDSAGSGWLRLTDGNNYEATSVRDTQAFNSANATIAVKFNYAAYGGNGADGTTFFLADASKTFATGAYGGSLGYANFNTGGTVIDGMAGGYIGLGLDEYGNYATMNEGKHGGYGTSTNLNAYPNAVSIRGPGSGQTGYDYLGGTAPFTPPFAFPNNTTRPTGTQARTFEIIITATNQVTVYMQAGDGAQMLPIFTADLSGYARPDQLIMGFTGSTGGQNDIHEIQGLALTSQAATLWTHGAATTAWGTASNWNGYGGTTPALGADVLLDNHYVSTAQTIDLAGTTQNIRSLQVDAPFSYTLNNGTIEFNSQGILGPVGIFASQGHGAANHSINANVVADENIEIKNLSSGTLAIGGNVSLGANNAMLEGTGATTISGQISGTGAVIKNDSGTATLNASNSYSGGTTLNGGTLSVGNNNALGTGGVILNGGTLSSTGGKTVANTLTLQSDSGLSNITTTGTLTQTGGSFTLNMSGATQSGIVNLSNNNTSRTLTVNVDTGTSTISGSVRDGGTSAGNLTKTGVGTLTLSGANTYTGLTTISAGALQLGGSNVLAATSSMNIAGSGALNLAGFSQQIGDLQAAGGATINFGTPGGANAFVFGNYTAPSSGVLVITNWESGGVDSLATTVGGQNVSSVYFSGQGVAQLAGSATSVGSYGPAYLLTPTAANTVEWDGSSSTAYSTGANWVGNAVPGNSAIALFDDDGRNRASVVLNRAVTLAGIKFGNTAGNASAAYNISGSTRTLTLAGTVPYIQQQNNFQNQTISVGNVSLNSSTVIDVTGSKNLTISSAIIGTGALIKDGLGAGKLILSGTGNNTFTGGVFINNGTLQAAKNTALGNAAMTTTILDGGTLEVTNGITIANPITVTGAGAGGGGAISNLAGNNTFSGTINETGATTVTAVAGTLTISGNITSTNQDTTFAGAGNINTGLILTGSGNVTMNGTGTLTFTGGTNTYTGLTTVDSGTLLLNKSAGNIAINGNLVIGDDTGSAGSALVKLGSANQISSTSAVTLYSDGKLDLNGGNNTIASFGGTGIIDNSNGTTAATLTFGDTSVNTFTGTITDTGANLSLVKQGTGKLTLTGANSYAGGTTLSSGIIAIQNNTALGNGTLLVQSGGNLEVAGGLTGVANAMTLNGAGTSAGDGAIQSTAGTNTLTGAITLGSATRIQSDAGSTLIIKGNISGTGMGLNLGGDGNMTINGNILTGTGGTLTKDGGGYVILNPTTNGSTFTGLTTISAGTLEIQKSSALGTAAGGVSVASGGTLAISGGFTTAESPVTLNGSGADGNGALRNVSGSNTVSGAISLNSATAIGSDAGTLTLSGVISGGAGNDLTKVGAGTVTLSGTSANTFSGNLSVADGTLILSKSTGVSASGPGTLTIGDSSGAANSAVLQLGANGQITSNNPVVINADGKFDVNGRTQTIGALSDGDTGQGSIALGNGTLTISSASSTSFSGSVSGTGTIVKSGSGTLTLTQGATTGAFNPSNLTLTAGTVQLGAGNIVGTATTVNLNGGTLSIGGNLDEAIGSLKLLGNSTIDFQNNTSALSFNSVIRTGGTLTISNWAGNPLGGGNSNLIFTNGATGFTGTGVFNEISFTGYGAGAIMLSGGEIVPNTGGTYYTWTSSTGGNWNTSGNWSPSGSPGSVGDTAILGNSITGPATISLNGANRTLGYLTIDSANNYTVTGNNLVFDVNAGTAQLINNNSGSSTIQSGLRLNDALTITQNGSGTLLISGGITNNSGANNITVAGPGNLNISGSITTGTASLTKNGAGTLTLGGTNTYSGGTTINGGVVAISNDNNLGGTSGALAINGGTLQNTGVVTLSSTRSVTVGANGGTFQTDGNLTYAGAIAGTGAINKNGAGSLISSGSGANTNTGAVNVNAGTLELAKSAGVSALGDAANITVAAGATLKFNGTSGYTAETIGSLAGAGTVNNASGNALALTLGGNNASTAFAGVIQNTGGALSMTKTGSGTFTLSGANAYTGATTISAGVLNIQNATALGTTSAGTSVTSGAALEIQGGIAVGAETLTLNGAGVGSNGALRNVSDTNSFAGAITLGSASTIKSESGALTLSGSISGTQNLTLDGAGALTLSGNIGTGTGTITKNGSGYVVFSGNNTYSGATAINAGTLEIRSANALGATGGATTVAAGATLALGGSGTTFAADPITLNGLGAGSLGALRNVSGTNTYAGNITLGSASIVGVDAGTTLTTTGLISGTSSVTKVGGGTLVLNHVNTYSGGTNITEGVVQVGASADSNLGATSGIVTLNGGTLNTTATTSLTHNVSLGPSGGTINTNASTTLTVSSVISGTSGGTLTKAGSGTLLLTGTNTYDGATTISGGNISISKDANLGGSSGAINFNGGGLIMTSSIATNRAITVSGTNTLSLGTNTLTFGGSLTGNGSLAVTMSGAGKLVFNSSIDFSAGSLTVSGGTLSLAGITANLGTLHITGNTTLDFGNSTASILNVGTFTVDPGVSVTVTNWVNMVDYFYATDFTGATVGATGSHPEDQITFTTPTSYPSSSTQWQGWDHEITPAPEPAAYGVLFLGACVGVFAWRKRKIARKAS